MAFSFYASLQAIPRELREASRVYRFSRLQTFLQLELPYGAIGLVWNSMVSVAGGWFFLMACEMFVLGKRDFRLPGLGSFLQSAASAGRYGCDRLGPRRDDRRDRVDRSAHLAPGDRVVGQIQVRAGGESAAASIRGPQPASPVAAAEPCAQAILQTSLGAISIFAARCRRSPRLLCNAGNIHVWHSIGGSSFGILMLILLATGCSQGFYTLRTITLAELVITVKSAGATFLRVAAALVIASAWAIPAGVAIGFHPRLARIAQPLAQIAASVPATALFPVILLG